MKKKKKNRTEWSFRKRQMKKNAEKTDFYRNVERKERRVSL